MCLSKDLAPGPHPRSPGRKCVHERAASSCLSPALSPSRCPFQPWLPGACFARLMLLSDSANHTTYDTTVDGQFSSHAVPVSLRPKSPFSHQPASKRFTVQSRRQAVHHCDTCWAASPWKAQVSAILPSPDCAVSLLSWEPRLCIQKTVNEMAQIYCSITSGHCQHPLLSSLVKRSLKPETRHLGVL